MLTLSLSRRALRRRVNLLSRLAEHERGLHSVAGPGELDQAAVVDDSVDHLNLLHRFAAFASFASFANQRWLLESLKEGNTH